jgi:hypothetical protein
MPENYLRNRVASPLEFSQLLLEGGNGGIFMFAF